MDHRTHGARLEYGHPSPTRVYGALSLAIGVFTCIVSIANPRLMLTYGGGPVIESTRDIVLRFAQHDQLMPLVSGVAVLGIALGAYGWRRNRSTLVVIGTVLSFWDS
jgi:hypothetical protein